MFRYQHYSEEGNRLVAKVLLRELGAKVAGFPECAARANP